MSNEKKPLGPISFVPSDFRAATDREMLLFAYGAHKADLNSRTQGVIEILDAYLFPAPVVIYPMEESGSELKRKP